MFDVHTRYQAKVTLEMLYPEISGFCACGCNQPLPARRKKWYSDYCRGSAFEQFSVIRGKVSTIRKLLYQKDTGACRHCGLISDDWEADHIVPVHLGGSACGLDNFQTLCQDCHKHKNQIETHLRAISSQAISTFCIMRTCDEGDSTIFSLKISDEKQRLGLGLSPASAI